MTQLTADQVRHIAKLARLKLSDDEVGRFAVDLTAILKYVEMLQKVDTKGVEPTAQVTGQESIFREDVIHEPLASPDSLLAASPLALVGHQIQTPSAHV